MPKYKKYLFILFTIPVFTLLLMPGVSAGNSDSVGSTKEGRWEEHQEKMEEKKQEIEAKKEEVQENREQKKEEMQAKKCEVLNNRLTNRIAAYESHKAKRLANYQKLLDKLDEILEAMEDYGLDTADLSEAIAGTEELVDEYLALYDDFITGLKDAQDLTCGDSTQPFKDAMHASKEELQDLRDKRKKLRDYYVDTVRPAIKGLREQAHELISSEAEEVTNE